MEPDVCHCIRCGRKKEPGTTFMPGTKGYKEHLYCSLVFPAPADVLLLFRVAIIEEGNHSLGKDQN